MSDLTDRARALSRHEHDDASIGDECADEIERLTAERDAANAVIDELLAVYTYKGLMLPARQRRRLAAIDAARALRKGTTCC